MKHTHRPTDPGEDTPSLFTHPLCFSSPALKHHLLPLQFAPCSPLCCWEIAAAHLDPWGSCLCFWGYLRDLWHWSLSLRCARDLIDPPDPHSDSQPWLFAGWLAHDTTSQPFLEGLAYIFAGKIKFPVFFFFPLHPSPRMNFRCW